MKLKFICLSIIVIAFLSSSMPKDYKDLKIGKEVPSISLKEKNEDIIINGNEKKIILNYWSPGDPASRVRNKEFEKIIKETGLTDIVLITVNTDKDNILSDQLIKLDKIEGDNIYKYNLQDLNDNTVNNYHLTTGNRSFLIDEKGILQKILPSYDEVIRFLQK